MEKPTTAMREVCDCGGELEELREAPFLPTTGPTGRAAHWVVLGCTSCGRVDLYRPDAVVQRGSGE